MENSVKKDFKKIKRDLLFYRHSYLIYCVLLLVLILISYLYYRYDKTLILFWFNLAVTFYIIYIFLFRLHKEKSDVRIKAYNFIETLTTLITTISKEQHGLIVLEQEFDEIEKKENAIDYLHKRFLSIFTSSINEGLEYARSLGVVFNRPFLTTFKMPDTLVGLREYLKSKLSDNKHELSVLEEIREETKRLYKAF
ncbi:hypothetical protein IJU97_02825 [bacterium]|nr:hypothetical protein [bacterium]